MMKNNRKTRERNGEIVTFFYMIFGQKVHEGQSPDEARHTAYDAVSLRYGISRGRLLNIISEQKNYRSVNKAEFRQNALSLINDLQTANRGLAAAKEKNERLIELLQDCLNDC